MPGPRSPAQRNQPLEGVETTKCFALCAAVAASSVPITSKACACGLPRPSMRIDACRDARAAACQRAARGQPHQRDRAANIGIETRARGNHARGDRLRAGRERRPQRKARGSLTAIERQLRPLQKKLPYAERLQARVESETFQLLPQPLRRLAIRLARRAMFAHRRVRLDVVVQKLARHEVLRIELVHRRLRRHCRLHRSL